jgi:hypothetical protein
LLPDDAVAVMRRVLADPHLARDENEFIATDGRHQAGGRGRSDPQADGPCGSYPASGMTAISDVDIVA